MIQMKIISNNNLKFNNLNNNLLVNNLKFNNLNNNLLVNLNEMK